MSKKLLEKATMIVRSANERTEQLCKKLILEQGVKSENVFIVREVPFSAAMEKSFKIGLDQDLKWTFCVDADVLLRPNSIKKMLQLAEKQKSNVSGIQSLIVDKFFGGPRDGGIHLYRTSLLKKVINKIPKEGIDIRPEGYTLEQMKKAGHPWLKIPIIVGLHDHEQYFKDIYRKCFTQGVKHVDRIELFVTLWRENLEDDPDFEVALKALADSISTSSEVYINRELDVFKQGFERTGINEKEEIAIGKYDLQKVEQIIEEWEYSDIYLKYFPYASGLISNKEVVKRKFSQYVDGLRKYGLVESTRKAIDYILYRL